MTPNPTVILGRLLPRSPPSSAASGGHRFSLPAIHQLRSLYSNGFADKEVSKQRVVPRVIPNSEQGEFGKKYTSDTSLQSKLVLYSFWQSSCSWRVRFALNLKGLSYEYKAVNLSAGEQFSQELEKLNPLNMVPVLVDGGLVVSDSYAILLYLEEKYPQKALLPIDPQRRALNLQVAGIISSSIQPLHMLSVLKNIEDKFGLEERQLWAQGFIEKGFLALEKLLMNFSGRYASGEEAYMADVFLAPQISVATMRFNIDMSKFPTLRRIYESCKVLPEFEASAPERQPDASH